MIDSGSDGPTGTETHRRVDPSIERAAAVRRRAVPRLHLITDDSILARPDFSAVADALAAVGGEAVAVHVRGPSTDGRTLHDRARALRLTCVDSGAMLVVNDRVDVAIAVEADAVQLGDRSLAPPDLPAAAGSLRVGVSMHSAEEAGTAEGVDWIVVGTIYPTPSHPGRAGSGPELLGAVSAVTAAPVLAIGGVTPDRVTEVMRSGAWGVAVMRGVWNATDPIEALHRYLEVVALDPTSDSTPTP